MPESSTTPLKEKWKNAISKFQNVIIPTQYNNLGKLRAELIDSVRVKLHKDDNYMLEIAVGTSWIKNIEYQMLRMSPDQLETCQLFYDNASQSLLDYTKQATTTIGKESKNKKDTQAFILAKDGALYIGNHVKVEKERFNLTHTSFLGGRPVEMAGILGINEQGKISLISDDSGHYQPKPLDIYRGIKRLQHDMPGVLAQDCKVYLKSYKLMGTGGKIKNLNEFLKEMESIGQAGIPLHQELRNQRADEFQQYQENLKKAISLQIISEEENLLNILANLTQEDKSMLSKIFANPMATVVIKKNPKDTKPQIYTVLDITRQGLVGENEQALHTLLEAGITKSDVFSKKEHRCIDFILSDHVSKNTYNILCTDHNFIKLLISTELRNQSTILHHSIEERDIEMIKLILQYPESKNLLNVKNSDGYTPIQLAEHYKEDNIYNILSKIQLEISENQQKTEIIKDPTFIAAGISLHNNQNATNITSNINKNPNLSQRNR